MSMNTERGFTLIEIIVSLAVFTVIGLGIVMLMSFIFTGSNKQSTLLSDSDQGRRVAFTITSELRNAVTANTGAYPIDTAGAQQLTFYSDIDGDSNIERVRYYISNGKLYRGQLKPSGSPLSYNSANEWVQAIQSNVANGATPLFYYYDGDYNGVSGTALSQPVNPTAVKFVKLNLRIFNKGGVTNTNYYTVTAGAAIRNLKTNLGD